VGRDTLLPIDVRIATPRDCEVSEKRERADMNDDQDATQGRIDGFFAEHVFKLLAISAFTLMAVGTIVYHFMEGWSWVDSIYFSVVAVTTVGFGEISPSTDASKLFTVVYILSGVGIIASYLSARSDRKRQKRIQKATHR
jgi:voltage-gated potassium channel Kch